MLPGPGVSRIATEGDILFIFTSVNQLTDQAISPLSSRLMYTAYVRQKDTYMLFVLNITGGVFGNKKRKKSKNIEREKD